MFEHFQKVDPRLFRLAKKLQIIQLKKSDNYFERLCDDIISQQLSGKASDTIFRKFKALFPNEYISPLFLMAIPLDQLRESGLSVQKTNYVKNLASHIIDKKISLESLDTYKDEIVIKELTKVKGIGRWTAEMFLIFSLAREDVFSYGDLGLRKGIQKLYGFEREPTLHEMEEITAKWRPYRTYASLLLWKSLMSSI